MSTSGAVVVIGSSAIVILTMVFYVLALAVLAVTALAAEQTRSGSPLDLAFRIVGLKGGSVTLEPQKEFKLIGAGFPRSGTKSTKRALEILGYKVLHMEDIASNGLVQDFLYALIADEYMDAYLNKILALGFNATLDGPMNLLTIEIFRRYPNAKVLFNERDSPEVWAESVYYLYQTFYKAFGAPFKWLIDMKFVQAVPTKYSKVHHIKDVPCEPTMWTRLLFWWDCRTHSATKDELVAHFHEHKNNVIRVVPKNKLLFFNVKQGWDPLVNFLGVSRPADSDFPFLNEKSEIAIIHMVFTFITIAWPVLLVVSLAAFVFLFRKITNPCFGK